MSLKQSNPLVTVYIPTFNRVELLKRAVDSVRKQTYQSLEIIIVDDCSNDGTHAYLEEIKKQDSRIRYFIKDKNSGACVSRNIAIDNASGEYITGLDDDDYFRKDRIESFVNEKDLLKKYKFLFSNYIYILKDKPLHRSFMEKIKPKVIKRQDLLSYNYVGNQIFIETQKLRLIKFNSSIKAWQDLYCWYGLLEDGAGYLVREFTYYMDMSHDHERISTQKYDKIQESYDKFCSDYNLNNKKKLILKNQLEYYGYSKEKLLLKCEAFLNSKNKYSLYLLSIKFFLKLYKNVR